MAASKIQLTPGTLTPCSTGLYSIQIDDTGMAYVVDENGNAAPLNNTSVTSQVDLDGIPTIVAPDNIRSKTLSVATIQFTWAESAVSNNEWMKIGRATDADTGHIMPHDGTIVGITGFCENGNSAAQYFRLYINTTQIDPNFAEFPAGTGNVQFVYTNKDVDFNRGDRIRIRAGGNGYIYDTNISLFIKWRVA